MTPEIDVVIGGEQQEADGAFDNVEYVMDAVSLGMPKGVIMLGHVISEQAGMEDFGTGCGRSSPTFRSASCRLKSRTGRQRAPAAPVVRKKEATLSGLLHQAIFMMQAAKHRCLHNAVTG
jgi:hypothetical protein